MREPLVKITTPPDIDVDEAWVQSVYAIARRHVVDVLEGRNEKLWRSFDESHWPHMLKWLMAAETERKREQRHEAINARISKARTQHIYPGEMHTAQSLAGRVSDVLDLSDLRARCQAIDAMTGWKSESKRWLIERESTAPSGETYLVGKGVA